MLTFAYEGGGGAKGSCLRNHSLEKMLNNLHKFFQGKRKSLESFYLLNGMFDRVLLEFYCTVVCLIMSGLIYYMTFFSFGRGGSQKSYVILMGGHAKCLLLMTRGEGGGSKIPKTCLRNTWMFP